MIEKANILITGATSKVGIELVAQLLRHSEAKLWVIIRKHPHARDPMVRFQQALMQLERPFTLQDYEHRIEIIAGDISKRGLGISDENFERLCHAQIDEVVNMAAFADRRNYSKENLFRVTYEGTHRLLRFAHRIGAKVFNQLGWLYASHGSAATPSVSADYLDFLDKKTDFSNLNEFVHRLTAAMIIRKAPELGMQYRIFQPGYFLDLENPYRINHRWFYFVSQTIFELSRLYRGLGFRAPTKILFPAADVDIYVTTPKTTARIMAAAIFENSATHQQIFDIFSKKLSVRDLLLILSKEFEDIELTFAESNGQLPVLERLVFKRSLIFFEYLMQHRHMTWDRKVRDLQAKRQIPDPEFSEAQLRRLARLAFDEFNADSERIPLPWLIRLRLLLSSRTRRDQAA